MWHIVFYAVLLASTGLYAATRGGAPERIAYAAVLVAVAATVLSSTPWTLRFATVEIWLFAIDTALFVSILLLAIYSTRYWAIWLAAIEALSPLLQIATWTGLEIAPRVYFAVHVLTAYPTLLVLVVGVWRHDKRVGRNGADPSWRNSSHRLRRKTASVSPTD